MRSFQNPREQCFVASVALGLLRRAVTAMHQEEVLVLWDLCLHHALERMAASAQLGPWEGWP